MDQVATAISTELLKYGLPGLVILAEGLIIWRLLNKIDRMEEKRDQEREKISLVIEANTRARESMNMVIEGQTRALESLTQELRMRPRGRS